MPSDTEEASQPTVNGDNVRALCDVVRELPIRAVIDLLSIGVISVTLIFLFLPFSCISSSVSLRLEQRLGIYYIFSLL